MTKYLDERLCFELLIKYKNASVVSEILRDIGFCHLKTGKKFSSNSVRRAAYRFMIDNSDEAYNLLKQNNISITRDEFDKLIMRSVKQIQSCRGIDDYVRILRKLGYDSKYPDYFMEMVRQYERG